MDSTLGLPLGTHIPRPCQGKQGFISFLCVPHVSRTRTRTLDSYLRSHKVQPRKVATIPTTSTAKLGVDSIDRKPSLESVFPLGVVGQWHSQQGPEGGKLGVQGRDPFQTPPPQGGRLRPVAFASLSHIQGSWGVSLADPVAEAHPMSRPRTGGESKHRPSSSGWFSSNDIIWAHNLSCPVFPTPMPLLGLGKACVPLNF